MLPAERSTTHDPFGTGLPSDIFDAAVRRINDIVVVTEADPLAAPDYRVLFVNPAFERISGYAPREIIGKSLKVLRGPGTSHEALAHLDAMLSQRKTARTELLNYRKDGTPFWVEIEASPLQSALTGNEYHVFIERDITARKAAEAALREQERSTGALLANLPGMAYRCSNDGARRMFFVSAGSLALTGYEGAHFTATGAPGFNELIHPDDREAVAEILARQTGRGEPYEITYRIRGPGGLEHWVLDKGRAVAGEPGAAVHLEGFVSDITERKLLEAQVLHGQRLESIGTLAGGIAHDLNNIFAPIMMAGDLLADKMTDKDSAQLVEAVSVSARRGAELVRQILIFARGMEGPRVAVSPAELFGELRSFLDRTLPKSIRVELLIDPALPPIAGNPSQLHQALLNLCVNARDAMRDGGRLTISATEISVSPSAPRPHPEAVPGDFIRIDISDTGCGIPGVIRNQIFDPFFTTKGVGQGTGLGLSTARSIVKSHGGFLTFDSSEGEGTTFHVHVPAASSGIGAQALGETPSEPSLEPLPLGQGEHVLVVDDEESVRVIMRSTLETFHYRVSTAPDGATALALVGRPDSKVDLALVDMQMPGMGGIETMGRLRQLLPNLPIMGSSGLATSEDREQAAALGVRHFLAKPFRVENLLRSVRSALAH